MNVYELHIFIYEPVFFLFVTFYENTPWSCAYMQILTSQRFRSKSQSLTFQPWSQRFRSKPQILTSQRFRSKIPVKAAIFDFSIFKKTRKDFFMYKIIYNSYTKSHMIHEQNHIWFMTLTCNLSCEKFAHVHFFRLVVNHIWFCT